MGSLEDTDRVISTPSSGREARVEPIHRTQARAMAKKLTEPLNTPIWRARRSPT